MNGSYTPRGVNGKVVVVVMLVGFVALCFIFGFGTYGLGKWMEPHFQRRAMEEEKKAAIQEIERREGRPAGEASR